jgi:hypothetical protein
MSFLTNLLYLLKEKCIILVLQVFIFENEEKKMKTKKTVIAVIAATLLVSAMLIVSCIDQIGEKIIDDEKVTNVEAPDYQIPAGKGVVRFKLAEDNIRTILPDFAPYTTAGVSNIAKMYFQVLFTRTTVDSEQGYTIYFPGNGHYEEDSGTPGLGVPSTKATYAEVTGPITLPVGNYSIVINAYNNIGGSINIARYTSTPITGDITVSSGQTSTAGSPFKLEPIIGTGNGGLFYSITIAADTYNTKTLEVYDSTNTIVGAATVTLNDDGTEKTGTIPLTSGYYTVKVTVAKDHYLTKQITEALHVYPGMTSNMTPITWTALVQNEFAVTFNMNDHTASNASNIAFNTQYIKYTKLATLPPVTPLTADAGYVFISWCKESTGTNAWNFGSDWVVNNTTLFAKWGLNKVWDIQLTAGEAMDPIGGGPYTIDIGTMNAANSITITLDPPAFGTAWTDIVWTIDGELDLSWYDDKTSITISNGINPTSGVDYSSILVDNFTVSVNAKLDNGAPYSRSVDVTITGSLP